MFLVEKTIRQMLNEFDRISADRKNVLQRITEFVRSRQTANLVFICTHNSRRSHIAQIWAQTAASYFNVPHVRTYSGGTEATAFNPRAVAALEALGFQIEQQTSGENPHYTVRYASDGPALRVFSKTYDDPGNPASDFAAIMTCSHADENCPVVTGASTRISLPFDDPKDFDGTDLESLKYHERSLEIGREILYSFSQIKAK